MNRDYRVVDTAGLKMLIREGIKYKFNRIGPLDQPFDPEGRHVLSLVLMYHNGRDQMVEHHRASVLAKIDGQSEPFEFYFDVRASRWDMLPRVPEHV